MHTRRWKIIDTFDDFLTYWSEAREKPLGRQIERWRAAYIAKYPELLAKQVRDYESQGLDWREIAREHVFPWLAGRLPLEKYLRRVESGESVRNFFGSWFEIRGKKQTGYFLGHEFIRWLEEEHSLQEITVYSIGDVRKWADQYLRSEHSQGHPKDPIPAGNNAALIGMERLPA